MKFKEGDIIEYASGGYDLVMRVLGERYALTDLSEWESEPYFAHMSFVDGRGKLITDVFRGELD